MGADLTPETTQSASNSAPSGNGWGGSRSNAGRKTAEATKARRDLNAAIDAGIEEFAFDLLDNLKRLADGGYKREAITEELAIAVYREEPACLVMRRVPIRDEHGRPARDPETGEYLYIEEPAYPDAKPNEMVTIPVFPDADPNQLVVVKRVTEWADADRAANEYLLNRRLGRPKQAVELSGPDGGAIPLGVEAAIQKVYGTKPPDQEEQETGS